jgi:protein SCO1/2
MKVFVRTLALGLLLLIVAGCRQQPPPPAPVATTTDYRLAGIVRSVQRESGQVVIRHEDIPGFMKAMTMPFPVKDRTLLDDLRAGDDVKGTLRVERAGGEVKDYTLVDLTVSKPALAAPPPLRLSTAGGKLQLAPVPRRLEPGEEVPDFTMTTEDGTTQALRDLRGNVVVLTFIYTRCPLPDFCPLMDRKFADLAAAVAAVPERARHVRLISLSFDPEHDTPEVLRKHARTQGAQPPLWTFAVAAHDQLARVAPGLGLTYGPTANEIIHNLSTAVIDPAGNLVSLRVGSEAKSWTTSDLLREIAPLAKRGKDAASP